MDDLDAWISKNNSVVMDIDPTPGTDEPSYRQLVKLLRDKNCYAVAGWEIPGNGKSTMNLLIAPFKQGLLGAAFPTTGIPEIPKPQLTQLDPAVRQTIFKLLSPQMRNLPEPQLSQAITQIFVGQQNRFRAIQGGSILT
jgi:mediator of RNA polymerase II transcription subunit 25